MFEGLAQSNDLSTDSTKVFCACGCGGIRDRFDKNGNERRYIQGHARRGMKNTPEAIRKIVLARTGMNFTEEHRRHISESHKGQRPWNAGTKGVCKAWNKGLKLPHLSGENSSRYRHGLSNAQEYNNELRRRAQKNNDPRAVYSRLKSHLKRKSAVLDWPREDFIEWYKSAPLICVYCGIEVKKYAGSSGPKRDAISIDRKDPKGPYSRDNCAISCMKCNIVKNDVLTYEQMKNIVGPLLKINRESS